MKSLHSNLWKYTIHLITNKRTYNTILGVYVLTLPDATAQTMGFLLLLGNLTGFLFEIPSGYLSDKMGHKQALVLARVAMLLSTMCYFIGSSVTWFLIGMLLLNIAEAFRSGTVKAFMYDTIEALGRKDEFSKLMGKMNSIGFFVPILFIVTIPFFVNISYQAAFIIPLILDVIGLITVSLFVVSKKSQQKIEEVSNTNFKAVMKEAYRYGFFPYAILIALIFSAITSSSNFKDIYQQAMGVPVMYYGIFWACSRVIVSSLLLVNHRVKDRLTFHQFLGIKFVLALVIILTLSQATSAWVVVCCFISISAFNWSFREAEHHYLFDIIGETQFKATLLSVIGLMQKVLIACSVGMIGFVSTGWSFSLAFLTVLALLSVFGGTVFAWILFKK